jgi:hypothetical protein
MGSEANWHQPEPRFALYLIIIPSTAELQLGGEGHNAYCHFTNNMLDAFARIAGPQKNPSVIRSSSRIISN